MGNRTIYVKPEDGPLFENVQNSGGGSISQKFAEFLRFEAAVTANPPKLQYAPLTTPTLRDQFAMAALNATISTARGTINLDDMAKASKHAYQFADAMLEARK